MDAQVQGQLRRGCAAYQKAHTESKGDWGRKRASSMLKNLFDSHGTARALWMLQGDTTALKMLPPMMACAPGLSMLYQGTEVGQTSANGLKGASATANRKPPGTRRRTGCRPPGARQGVNHLRRDPTRCEGAVFDGASATRPSRAPRSEASWSSTREEGRSRRRTCWCGSGSSTPETTAPTPCAVPQQPRRGNGRDDCAHGV